MPRPQQPETSRVALLSAICGAILLSLCGSHAFAQAEPGPTLDPLPEGDCGLQTTTITLPNLGETLVESKLVDCANGTIQAGVTDAEGNPVDLNAAMREEAKARQADPLAKIHKDLLAQLAVQPNKRIPVIVWLTLDTALLDGYAASLLEPREPALGQPPPYDEGKLLDVKDDVLSFNRSVISQVTRDFARRAPGKILFVAELAPVVVVRANADEALEMAQMTQTDTLYPDLLSGTLNLEGLVAHRVLPDWLNARLGLGRRIAVLEGERIEPGVYLDVEETFRPGTTVRDGHPQLIAGVIQSRWWRRPGTAMFARLFSANVGTVTGCDSATAIRDCAVTQGAEWVIDRHVEVTNLSWGGPLTPVGEFFDYAPDGEMHYLDRLFDHHARYNLHTVVAAAGNQPSDYVHSPATAWNVIAVGAVRTHPVDPENPDAPDPDPADWSNDVMEPGYSYDNPLNGNFKPNVAARGVGVRTLSRPSLGWAATSSGTSLAAPFVTATAALAMNRNPTLLASPEAVMATLMASAWNNVEGPEDRPISNRDGAGGIHTSAATRLAGNYRVIYTYVTPASVAARGYHPIPVELVAGERTRIAVSWFADTAVPVHELGYIQTDIDVLVFEGPPEATGFIRGFSVSKFNNTEIVDFVPEVTGTHTIALYTPRQIGNRNDRVGIAVSRYDVDTP